MYTKEIIEDIILKELQHLCTKCVHTHTCVFQTETNKIIIQCEFFKLDDELHEVSDTLQGLCKNCDHAIQCALPGKNAGVWHCDEYQ